MGSLLNHLPPGVENVIYLKKGVTLVGVRPEILRALEAAAWRYSLAGYSLVVTSTVEGQHSPKSLHYVGLAADLRTKTAGMTRTTARQIVDELRNILGKHYDIIAEDTHIHLEFQPKESLV